MLHLRITMPQTHRDAVLDLLQGDAAVVNLVLLPATARGLENDLLMCDVPREQASRVIEALEGLLINRCGSIAVHPVDMMLSDAADRAMADSARLGAEAVVWEELEAQSDENARLTGSFLAFLILATLIAAVGVVLDQSILIVGAMVVGPEYGPISAICIGVVRRQWRNIGRGLVSLLVGFALAVVATAALAALARMAGWISATNLLHRSQTAFITQPDMWSLVVAVLAGIAGMLSTTAAKPSTLVGVFISVTTVPAVASGAVAIALGVLPEATDSLIQLGLNMLGLILAGVATLAIQRLLWARAQLLPAGMPRRRLTR